jgi:K+-sensing histidine kinase KdpD
MDKPDKSIQGWVVLASFASLAVVAYLDYITGYEIHFHVFYFIPVSICAWHLRRREVVGMVVVSALTWGLVDINSGHPYRHWGFWCWNTGVCFAILLILGLVLQRLRDNLKQQLQARRELEQALADLRQSTAEAQKLQSQLQVVCAWTHRIKVEGKWMTFEEFLQKHLHVQLTHGMSPEAVDKFAREIEGKAGMPPPQPGDAGQTTNGGPEKGDG